MVEVDAVSGEKGQVGVSTKGFSVWWGLDSSSKSGGVCFQDAQKEDRGFAKRPIKHDAYVTVANIPASNPCLRTRYSEIQRVARNRSL